jgi:hypothetical protein
VIAGGGTSTPSTGPVNTTGTGSTDTTGAPTTEPHNFQWTDGWYLTIACVGSVMVANTKVGPLAFGILTVALIYQLNLLLQGK